MNNKRTKWVASHLLQPQCVVLSSTLQAFKLFLSLSCIRGQGRISLQRIAHPEVSRWWALLHLRQDKCVATRAMLHLVLSPLCANCYSHHYSQVTQTQQPAHPWIQMDTSCKRVKKQTPKWCPCRIISFPPPGSASSFSFFNVSSLFFLPWLIRCSRESCFYDIRNRKKSSTVALTAA